MIEDVTNSEIMYDDEDVGESIAEVGSYSAPTSIDAVLDFTTNTIGVMPRRVLTEFDVMKANADQMGFRLADAPKKGCNKCYGRGFTAKDAKTGVPVPCKCIFPKMSLMEKNKNDELSKKLEMANLNREGKRRMEKFMLKNAESIITDMEKRTEVDEYNE